MKHTIKKGDKYLCIKDYVMDGEEDKSTDFSYGYSYTVDSVKDNGVEFIDDDRDEHEISFKELEEHFTLVSGNITPDTVNVSNTALRYNDGKPQWSLVHFKSLEPFVRVLEYGAHKYSIFEKPDGTKIKGIDCTPEEAKNYKVLSSGRDNWKKGLNNIKILDSAMRHLSAMIDGEVYDKESNLLHSSHLFCNLMFYNYNLLQNGDLEKD